MDSSKLLKPSISFHKKKKKKKKIQKQKKKLSLHLPQINVKSWLEIKSKMSNFILIHHIVSK